MRFSGNSPLSASRGFPRVQLASFSLDALLYFGVGGGGCAGCCGEGAERECCLRNMVTGLAFETYGAPDLVTFAAECCITNCQAKLWL